MTTYTIKEVLKNKKKAIVKIIEPNMKEYRNKFDYCAPFKFPDSPIYIIKVDNDYGSNVLYITFLSEEMNEMSLFVPVSLEVRLCSVKEKKRITITYNKYIIDVMKLAIKKFPLGSDPEIFVEDKDANIIPAYEFLPDKKNPFSSRYNNLYWDGFQAEFTTRAEQCLAWQVDSVQNGLKYVIDLAKQKNKDAKLSTKTCMIIPNELLKNGKDEHVEFGCMPSKNVYGMKGLTASGRDLPYRSAGGHIHFGFGKMSQAQINKIVKALDAIIGVACVSLFANYDDPKRRNCYGLAGEYRLPKHGLEYRVLSNAWMFHPLIMNMVFDVSRAVVTFALEDMMKYWKGNINETIEVINKCNVDKAREILKRNEKIFKMIIRSCYFSQSKNNINLLYDVFCNGIDSVVKDVNDIESNWNLKGEWRSHSDGKDKNVLHAMETLVLGKKVA